MLTLNTNDIGEIEKRQYAFEVMMGLGFGLVLTSLLTLIPLVVKKDDMPIVIAAVTQVRNNDFFFTERLPLVIFHIYPINFPNLTTQHKRLRWGLRNFALPN